MADVLYSSEMSQRQLKSGQIDEPWVARLLKLGSIGLCVCRLLLVDERVANATPAPSPPSSVSLLSIEQAVDFALAHHPSLPGRGAIEDLRAAQTAQVRLAMLPRVDLSAQLVRATGNVVVGAVWSQPGMPAVTGPPMPAHFDGGAFASALSLGGVWDLTGLAQRMAQVDAALAAQAQAQAATEARRLDVAYGAADAYLQVWAAQAVARSTAASVERARLLAAIVESYQRAELRPGADLSRARAELALSESQHEHAEERHAISRALLAQAIGAAGAELHLAPPLLNGMRESQDGSPEASVETRALSHPVVREADSATQAAAAQVRATRLQYLPRVDLVAALWSRGSGLGPTETAAGMVPDTPNWGVGLVASWSPMEAFSVRQRTLAARAQQQLAQAQSEETLQAVRTQLATASASQRAAIAVLQHAPIALGAAKLGEQQAVARYKAGLARLLEVSDAQRLLAQAEAGEALAQVGVLRAQLLLCRALGDLAPCLQRLHAGAGGS
jgi:outer membrane protein